MKKGILLGILILILATALLMPWVSGYLFERRYAVLINQLNGLSQSSTLSLEGYQRGWFSSNASIKISVHARNNDQDGLQAVPSATETIILQQHISHGPLIRNKLTGSWSFALASINTQLHLPAEVESFLLGDKQNDGIVTIYTIAHFNDTYQNQLMSPSLTINMQPFGQLKWQGAHGESTFMLRQGEISQLQTELTVGALSMTSDATSPAFPSSMIDVQPITIKNTASKHASGLWVGRSEVTLAGLTIKQNNIVQLAFDNLQIISNTSMNTNELYNIDEKVTLHKLQIPQTSLAVISPANITLKIQNINPKELIPASHAVSMISASALTKAERQKDLLKLFALVSYPGTTLDADIFINTGLGALQVKGDFASVKDKPSATMGDVLNNAQYHLSAKVAAPLANQLLLFYATVMEANAIQKNSQNIDAEKASGKDKFNAKVAQLLQEGQITLPMSIEVMDAYDQRLSPAEFTQKLTKFGIVAQTVADLSQFYTQLYNKQSTSQANDSNMPIAANPQNVANALRDQFISEGYLIKEGNDYTFSISRENGVMRMNGGVAPSSSPTTP